MRAIGVARVETLYLWIDGWMSAQGKMATGKERSSFQYLSPLGAVKDFFDSLSELRTTSLGEHQGAQVKER